MPLTPKHQKLVKYKVMRAKLRQKLNEQKKRADAAFIEINVIESTKRKAKAKHESILNEMEETETTLNLYEHAIFDVEQTLFRTAVSVGELEEGQHGAMLIKTGTEVEDASSHKHNVSTRKVVVTPVKKRESFSGAKKNPKALFPVRNLNETKKDKVMNINCVSGKNSDEETNEASVEEKGNVFGCEPAKKKPKADVVTHGKGQVGNSKSDEHSG